MKEIKLNQGKCEHYICVNDKAQPQCCYCLNLPTDGAVKKNFRSKYGNEWEKRWEQLKKNMRLVRGRKTGLREYIVREKINDDKIIIRTFYENSND